ncbi:MAG: hypothetical protein KDC95_23665 [Planctomycetes bacterium]|nr:hypothetical protein [Planctomycetota bacterium]
MPARPVETYHCSQVEDFLHDHGFAHLRARKYGSTVIVESGPKRDAIKHVRVRRDTVHLWLLDVANHRGKWERTHLRAPLNELLGELVESFPWALASRE